MKNKRSKKWSIAKQMPPLKHSTPGQIYDIRNSEAAKWLCSQPDIMQIVFESVKDCNEITYDSDTGTWRGVDYVD